eukprot:Ihof_evm3s336 gene=Ihof_evmTU3s336
MDVGFADDTMSPKPQKGVKKSKEAQENPVVKKTTYKIVGHSNFFSCIRIVAFSAVIMATVVYNLQAYSFIETAQEYILPNTHVGVSLSILCILFTMYWLTSPTNVYLIDFATFKPDKKYTTTTEHFMDLTKRTGLFDQDALDFQEKLIVRTGLGSRTCFPEAMHRADDIRKAGDSRAVLNIKSSREEAELVMFTVVEQLLKQNGLVAKDIDILIVNCSLFNPTPSLSAMIVNHFKMRDDILTYNLAGMGCSAGIISIDLAKDILRMHKNSRAIIVSTENITQNWYTGREKSMLITNTLFRMGGAAILLSSRPCDSSIARYKLLHTVRTHKGADDLSYNSVYQDQDAHGILGVRLSKTIMEVSAVALRKNITTLGPLILPLSEKIKYVVNYVHRKYLGSKQLPAFMPNFKKAVDHFCIHTGGRAVIDTLEKVLSLTPYDVAPSRFALERFGNTSSSSI